MNTYQLIVIGGGPGGYIAAIRAAQLGLKTALVERDKIGGTCLNRGCIPTKALLHSASAYAECAHFDQLGLAATGLSYNMEKIHARKAQVVDTLRGGVEQLLKANRIEVIRGMGTITSTGVVSINGTTHTTDRILIATGSVPARPPIHGLNLTGVVTSDEILEGPVHDYRSLVIIGGGVIGVEMASIYADLGCTVTIVEAMECLLPQMDREISQNMSMILKKRGVRIFCSARVEKIEEAADGLACIFSCKEKTETITAEGVLVAIGRRPNTEKLFAATVSEVTPAMERGFIKVNDSYETSVPGIYAVGDVIGGVQLAHKAEAEGLAAVELMCGKRPATDPHLVPSCIYTNPEIASVGISADDAKREGRAVKTAKYLMAGNGKSVIDLQERGFIKVVFDAETDVLLGVQMMCGRATDLVSEFTGAILNGMTHAQLLRGMRPHPSFCEGITEALEAIDGLSIHSAPARK